MMGKDTVFMETQCPFKNSLCRTDCAIFVQLGHGETAGCCAILSLAVDLTVLINPNQEQEDK